MTDIESLLRAALTESAPLDPATDGLADGARRYAAHARRVRLASVAAGLVLVLAGGGAVASGAFRDRAVTPVVRVGHLTCALSGQDLPSATMSRTEPMSSTAREVLVCADGSAASVWPGSLPADEPVSSPADLDFLRFDPPDRTRACAALPAGPAYRMLVLGLDGVVSVRDNQTLACNGWPALDRYFIALGDQQWQEWASTQTDPFLKCPSVLQQRLLPASDAPAALRPGSVFAQATACFYPLPDASRLPRASEPPWRTVLSTVQIAVLNADIGRKGSAKVATRCAIPQTGMVVVNTVTTSGQSVVLSGVCGDGSGGTVAALVNWVQGDQVVASLATTRMLNAALGIPGP
ncbi:hypothetical protein [Nostocoides sp. HKS02]|uniref:hypothetical protein n=1 Tax=Nostocoides sp. HKS02 TaxID=1813880 RepID=UPI0012B471C2|nr:hypothetical protein [Tetrasphaera sp. HKS02]QGN59244.1 hypothetical protein GKE56_16615 [Tetrasphaera sp. HKS02]